MFVSVRGKKTEKKYELTRPSVWPNSSRMALASKGSGGRLGRESLGVLVG